MFKQILFDIQNDLEKHHRNKQALSIIFVQERLNKSLKSYYEDLSKSVNYLEQRDAKNVIKEL